MLPAVKQVGQRGELTSTDRFKISSKTFSCVFFSVLKSIPCQSLQKLLSLRCDKATIKKKNHIHAGAFFNLMSKHTHALIIWGGGDANILKPVANYTCSELYKIQKKNSKRKQVNEGFLSCWLYLTNKTRNFRIPELGDLFI